MDRLLQEIAEQGWKEESREEFVRRYDRLIGRGIVYFLARYRELEAGEIHRLLESVERRFKGQGELPEPQLLDLVEEVYLRVYEQVFREKLIQDYVEGHRRGRIKREFSAYLRGVVRNRVIDHLRKERPRFQEFSVEEWEERVSEGSPDWAKALRADWWDRLIRCLGSEPQGLEELRRATMTLEEEAARHTGLCLACAQIKSQEAGKAKENIRMFLVYYLSNYGTGKPAAGERRVPAPEELSLEGIRGLRLSWAEVFQAFGRECNPTRVRAEIRKKLEELHHE